MKWFGHVEQRYVAAATASERYIGVHRVTSDLFVVLVLQQ